jgi:hypothetical protein
MAAFGKPHFSDARLGERPVRAVRDLRLPQRRFGRTKVPQVRPKPFKQAETDMDPK